MTGNDRRAENLAAWLRERGHECRVLREEACTDAVVLVEGTDWSFVCARNPRGAPYFPRCVVDEKIKMLDPVETREQVLSLISGE